MNHKLTILLSIIFLLCMGILIALYTGWIKSPVILSPLSFRNSNGTVQNLNANIPLKNLIKREPNTTYDAAIRDGDQYFAQGDYQDAIDEYIHAAQLDTTKIEPYQKLGDAYLLFGDYDKAFEKIQYVINKDPTNEGVKISLAKVYIRKSDFNNALDVLLSLNPDNQEVRYYIGILRAYQGDMEKALNNLMTAAQLNPESGIGKKAQNTLANIQEFNLFMDGKNIHLRTLLARSFIQNGEYQLAIAMLKDILKDNKTYRDAWVLLGFSYYLIGKNEMALETLNNAYDLDPEKPETQYFLGLTYMKLNNNEKALTFLILALKNGFEPRSDVQKKLADLYLITQHYDEALKTYLDIIQEGKVNDINNYVRPIWIYIDIKKQPMEALHLAQQAHTAYPDSAMGYNLLGWAALANDDLVTAEENLDIALKKDPNIQAVYLNLGDLYAKKGEKEKAKDFYKRAYFMDKNSSIGNLAASKYNTLQTP